MLEKLIQNKIKTLPKNIQYALAHFPWHEAISNIAKKYQLQIDEEDILLREVLLVLVGLEDAEKIYENILKHLSLDEKTAGNLIAELNQKVFIPLQRFAFQKEAFQEEKTDFSENDSSIKKEKLFSALEDEGIQLVEEEEHEKPKTSLQALADQLFGKKKINEEENKEAKREENKEEEILEDGDKKESRDEEKEKYHEKILFEDLKGIYEHRNPAYQNKIIEKKEKSTPIENKLNKEIHLGLEKNHNYSPTKKEEILENGDFLKHIGAV